MLIALLVLLQSQKMLGLFCFGVCNRTIRYLKVLHCLRVIESIDRRHQPVEPRAFGVRVGVRGGGVMVRVGGVMVRRGWVRVG